MSDELLDFFYGCHLWEIDTGVYIAQPVEHILPFKRPFLFSVQPKSGSVVASVHTCYVLPVQFQIAPRNGCKLDAEMRDKVLFVGPLSLFYI